MDRIIVTTSRDRPGRYRLRAEEWAARVGGLLVARDEGNLVALCDKYEAEGVIVVSSERVTYYEPRKGLELFFHPNLASVHIHNIERGSGDHLITAAGLVECDEVLDCTLGRASDAILMAWVVGETGRVVAIEKVPVIAWLTIEGLREREFVSERFTQTMRRVDARCADYNDFLPTCADDEFDVVYFDPVFHRPVEESESMKDLRDLAHKGGLTAEAVAQALRVARRCVVIKQRQETPLWKELGVTEIHGGPQSRVEYGVLRP